MSWIKPVLELFTEILKKVRPKSKERTDAKDSLATVKIEGKKDKLEDRNEIKEAKREFKKKKKLDKIKSKSDKYDQKNT